MLNCISKMSTGKSELLSENFGTPYKLVQQLTNNNNMEQSRNFIKEKLQNSGFKKVESSVVNDLVDI